MRRATLYSRSSRAAPPTPTPAPAPEGKAPTFSWRALYKRHEKAMLVAGTVFVFLAFSLLLGMRSAPPAITQADIDAAVVRALKEKTLPSPAAKAYEAVRA